MLNFGKSVVLERTKWGKVFHTRKALFSLEQIHLAAFLAVLRLKAEKQQQESMQATG